MPYRLTTIEVDDAGERHTTPLTLRWNSLPEVLEVIRAVRLEPGDGGFVGTIVETIIESTPT